MRKYCREWRGHNFCYTSIMQRDLVEKEVQKITRQLLDVYRPQKIILFGSAVRLEGEVNDLDILIVKGSVPYRGIDRMRQVRSLIETEAPVDFLVVTPQELEKRQTMRDPFVLNILEHGRVLYG